MKRQYPFYVVCITLDPRIVDVNVHPRKSEVRFANNQVVYAAIYSMISKVLDGTSQSLNLIVSAPFLEEQPINPEDCAIQKYEVNGETRYYIDPSKEPKSENYLHLHLADKIKASAPDESKYVGEYVYEKPAYRQSRVSDFEKKLKQVVDLTEETPDESNAADDIFKANQEYIRQLEAEKAAYTQAQMPTDTPVRYIGQALSTYLLVESANQLIVIDQHAAHDRERHAGMYQAVNALLVLRADGDRHGNAGTHRKCDEQGDEQIDQRAGCPHGGKRLWPRKTANHNNVGGVIERLQDAGKHHGNGEGEYFSEQRPLCQIHLIFFLNGCMCHVYFLPQKGL